MKTKEVEISVNGKPTKVLLRSLYAGEHKQCLRASLKIYPQNMQANVFDPVTYYELALPYAVVEPRDLVVEKHNVLDLNKVEDSAALSSQKGQNLLESEEYDKLMNALASINEVNPLGSAASGTQ